MTKLTLYTNHRCPWAHRAHIALAELGVPFDEVIIDLDRPREPWYLEINPRGLVPALRIGEGKDSVVLTESAVVTQYLADAYPDRAALVPVSSAPGGALARARIAFFVDAYFSKLQTHLFKLGGAKTAEAQEALGAAFVAAAAQELEPLLAGTTTAEKPFFGGSARLTLAEALVGSFAVRLVALAKAGVYPATIPALAAEQAPAFWAWFRAVAAHPSVTAIFDEAQAVKVFTARLAAQRAAA